MPHVVPPVQYKYIGETAEFNCHSGKPVSWGFEDRILPKNVEVSGERHEIINIFNVQLKNTGAYKCITKDSGSKEHVLNGILVVNCKLITTILAIFNTKQ